jgi:hypothetical protein
LLKLKLEQSIAEQRFGKHPLRAGILEPDKELPVFARQPFMHVSETTHSMKSSSGTFGDDDFYSGRLSVNKSELIRKFN